MVHGQWWLENCSQHCLKRKEADSLSSAVVEVKISGFVLKIRSLHQTPHTPCASLMEQKTGFKFILLNWSR